jgi:hypothetical protein
MALRLIVDKATSFAAKHYQKAVASQLQQVGKLGLVSEYWNYYGICCLLSIVSV